MAGLIEDLQTLITTWIDNNKGLFALVIQIPFWFKTFINSYLINKRDQTQYFILLLNPFSESAREHGFESMFRFYWKLGDQENLITKKLVNFLSAIFGIIILTIVLNGIYEWHLSH